MTTGHVQSQSPPLGKRTAALALESWIGLGHGPLNIVKLTSEY